MVGPCQQESFTFEAFQGDFLRKQDVAAREVSHRCKAPNRLALSRFVYFINVHAGGVADHIAPTAIAADHVKPVPFREGGPLAAAQVRTQKFVGSLFDLPTRLVRGHEPRPQLAKPHAIRLQDEG